jgi:hypothetical protein
MASESRLICCIIRQIAYLWRLAIHLPHDSGEGVKWTTDPRATKCPATSPDGWSHCEPVRRRLSLFTLCIRRSHEDQLRRWKGAFYERGRPENSRSVLNQKLEFAEKKLGAKSQALEMSRFESSTVSLTAAATRCRTKLLSVFEGSPTTGEIPEIRTSEHPVVPWYQ